MAKTKSITEVTTMVYELLSPLEKEERQRVLSATMALLGDTLVAGSSQQHSVDSPSSSPQPEYSESIGGKAARWMRQNQVAVTQLDPIFHIDNGTVELITTEVHGKSKRIKTTNCYLLVGIKNLLASDEPKFTDREAIEFCHLTNAYDKNNHTSNRNALGNRVSGDRSSGFTLTVPGLRDAAKLIKEMGG